MANPTIVVGQINGDELLKSIDKLVSDVQSRVKKLETPFNTTIDNIKKKLGELGNLSVNIDTSASTNASNRRASAQKIETQAVKETTSSYDQLANAIKQTTQVTGGKSISTFVNEASKELSELQKDNAFGQKNDLINKIIADFQKIAPAVSVEVEKIKKEIQRLKSDPIYLHNPLAQLDVKTLESQLKVYQNALQQVQNRYGTTPSQISSPQTLKDWENLLAVEKQRRKEMEAEGVEIEHQNRVIEELEKKIKGFKAKTTDAESVRSETKLLGAATSMPTKTLEQAEAKLKRLTELQGRFKKSGLLDESKMNRLQNAIDNVRTKIEQLKAKAPKSLEEVIGMKATTVDEIAKKMRMLKQVQIDPNNAAQVRLLSSEYQRLARQQNELLGKGIQLTHSNNLLAQSFGYIRNRIVYALTLGVATSFIKQIYEIRAQYELLERSLGVLVGSFQKGSQIFNELNQMALKSPFTLIELGTAAKQLTAYNFAADEVVNTTRRLADISAALGVPMERLTYNLGQIRAQTALTARDARDFANAGLPIVKSLADYFTKLEGRIVSTGDVYDRMSKKMVSYNDVMAVLNQMTDEGGKFFDFQAKQAETLKVQLANLSLAWNNLLNDIGSENQTLISLPINALKTLFVNWQTLNKLIWDAIFALGFFKTAGLFIALTTKNVGELSGAMLKLYNDGVKTKLMFGKLWSSIKAIAAPTGIMLLVSAFIELGRAIINANEATHELNNSIREGAKQNADSLRDYIASYQKVRDSLYKTTIKKENGVETKTETPVDIDESEAKKVWESMREQIKLTTGASDLYISQLMSIENVSERIRRGFDILSDVQAVNSALEEIGKNGIKITQEYSAWWNLWIAPDGLIQNIKDYNNVLNSVVERYGSIKGAISSTRTMSNQQAELERAGKAKNALENLERANKKLQSDLDVTTQSIIDLVELKGWSGDTNKINEVFGQVASQIIMQNQLDPQEAFILQQNVEVKRAEAAKKALQNRIADEKAALSAATDANTKREIQARLVALSQEFENFDKYNGKTRVVWTNFTEWIKNQHVSETRAMFGKMSEEQLQNINWSEKKYREFIEKNAKQYAKEHQMSYDEAFNYLWNWVNKANTWKIFIQTIIGDSDTNLQAEVKKRIYEAYQDNTDQFNAVLPSANDTFTSWVKARQDQIKSLTEENKKYAKDNSQWAKNQIADNDKIIDQNKKILDLFNQPYAADKKGGSKKDPILEVLKEQISLVEKLQGEYDKLRKKGASSADAFATVSSTYEGTLKMLNEKLSKYGFSKFGIAQVVGKDPHQTLAFFNNIKKVLESKGLSNLERMKAVEGVIEKFKVKAKEYNLEAITNGLNNELGKLKDEYELAVELDANPELGNMFADMFNIDKDALPHTFDQYLAKAQKEVDNQLRAGGLGSFDILYGDVDKFVEANDQSIDSNLVEKLRSIQKEIRNAWKKDIGDTISGYNKLLEKYSEFEYKVSKIQNDSARERVDFVNRFGSGEQKANAVKLETDIAAEDDPDKKLRLIKQLSNLCKEVAGDDETKINLAVAIDTGEQEQLGQVSFEEFQKSPEWVAATGDLAQLANSALKSLIRSLEQYRKSSKNLNPKQIKELNKALNTLRKEQRKDNPFMFMANAADSARARMDLFQPAIDGVNEKITKLLGTQKDTSKLTDKQKEEYEKLSTELNTLTDNQKKVGKISATEVVDGINASIAAAANAISMFTDMADALGGSRMTEASQTIKDVVGVLEKAGQGAAIGAQIGGGWGALIGGVVGTVSGLVTAFVDTWNGNAGITKSIQKSEREVKRLEIALSRLQNTAENSYGALTSGANRAVVANKQLQLAEMKRQLELEKSRKKKNRDEDRILELEQSITDLELEIHDATQNIVNDLLGISSAGDGITSLVQSMIDAFRNGEDAMEAFSDSWDKMIDNMILKLILSTYLQKGWDIVMKKMEEKEEEFMKKAAEEQAEAQKTYEESQTMSDKEIAKLIANDLGYKKMYASYDGSGKAYLRKYKQRGDYQVTGDYGYQNFYIEAWQQVTDEEIAAYKEWASQRSSDTQSALDQASLDYNKWALEYMAGEGKDFMTNFMQDAYDALSDYYTFGENNTALSALQQGIQGITEDTAGALEAYMNGVSQQVYLQSDLLTQIRDAVVGFDLDVQVATMSQILLQLQSSYQVQVSIQNILNGVLTPSGRAFMVELNS